MSIEDLSDEELDAVFFEMSMRRPGWDWKRL